MSEGVLVALIGLAGAVVTAVIGAYATLAAARMQNNITQNSTTTTRRLVFFSKIPRSLIISLGAVFTLLMVMGLWMWSNGDGTLTLNDIRRDNSLLAKSQGASFSFGDDNNLEIVGCWFTPVWVDHRLTDNFNVRVKFMTSNDKHEFILGMGDGSNMYSGFSYAMLPSKTLLRKLYPEKNMINLKELNDPLIKPNTWYIVNLERRDGELRVYLDGQRIFLHTDAEVGTPRYIYITSQAPQCDNGTVIISDLEIGPT